MRFWFRTGLTVLLTVAATLAVSAMTLTPSPQPVDLNDQRPVGSFPVNYLA
jgi:hypothetical protein